MDAKMKEKWLPIMTADFMSSEDSASDEEDAIIVRPLEWRNEKVTRVFNQLDEKTLRSKTPQAKRQRKSSVLSTSFSQHPQPISAKYPSWAFN